MAKVTPISEQFQHFFEEAHEDFWGSLYERTKQAWKRFLDADSQRQRDLYCGLDWYERGGGGSDLIATVIMSGTGSRDSGRFGYGLPGLARRISSPRDCIDFSGVPSRWRC
jgi:hypothetical protein